MQAGGHIMIWHQILLSYIKGIQNYTGQVVFLEKNNDNLN